jgi:HSP20 family protein
MAITDLVPWKKPNDKLTVRSGQIDPFLRMRQEIDEIFNGMLGEWSGRMGLFNRGGTGSFMPVVEVTETVKEIRVIAELPGLDEKDLEVSLLDGSLWIKGEKREEHKEERGDVYSSERCYGSFERVIPLPGGGRSCQDPGFLQERRAQSHPSEDEGSSVEPTAHPG